MTEFAKDCLAAHNEVRAKHGAPPLELSDKLTEHAQGWANNVAERGSLQHSHGSGYGENIAMSGGADVSARSFVQNWYSEVEQYDFNHAGLPGAAGHFSQVVWKGSKELGVGMVKKRKNDMECVYVVCNYNPPGNRPGEFGSNVQAEQ